MQLSFNVIKNSRVITHGDSEITTQISGASQGLQNQDNNAKSTANMESYQNIASNILENARRRGEEIISKAYVEAAETKTQAYEEGFEQGSTKGYNNAYNEAIGAAMEEASSIRARADAILTNAKAEYNDYIVEKEKNIKALIVNIAQSILKKEVVHEDALNEMIFNTLKAERNIKLYIIKINKSHFEMVKSQVENFKAKLAFQGDIFVIEDDFLEDGTAVVEKETGKSILSIEYGIEKIVELMREEQI